MPAIDITDARLLARLTPWQERAFTLINKKLADSAAHAHLSLTETLKNTPEGRQSAMQAKRSPSYKAAINRLDDLLDALVRLVRRSREAFYKDSFDFYRDAIDRDHLVSADPSPTKRGITNIRAALIHNSDLHAELSKPVLQAHRNLGPTVVSAANRDSSKGQSRDLIKTWRLQSAAAITRAALLALSDSDQRAHTQALLDILKPSKLDKKSRAASIHS